MRGGLRGSWGSKGVQGGLRGSEGISGDLAPLRVAPRGTLPAGLSQTWFWFEGWGSEPWVSGFGFQGLLLLPHDSRA